MAISNWNIDPLHSSILFGIRHLMIATVRGRFSKIGGTIALDDGDLTRSSVKIEVDVASLDTSVEQRDGHLRSPDFFDVAQFPKATFASRSIAREGEHYGVTGDLTLHGITKEVVLKATFGGTAKDPMGRERVAFGATVTLDRAAFGLKWNQALEAGGWAVGPTANLEIEVQGLRA